MKITIPTEGNIVIDIQYNDDSKITSASITSDLKVEPRLFYGDEDNAYNSAIDGIEAMLLAHACAGVRVTEERYVEGLEVAIEAVTCKLPNEKPQPQDKVREAAENVVAVYEWDDWNDDIIVLISPIVELKKVLQNK